MKEECLKLINEIDIPSKNSMRKEKSKKENSHEENKSERSEESQ